LLKFSVYLIKLLIFPILFLSTLASNSYCQVCVEKIPVEILMRANHYFEKREYDSAVLLYEKFLTVTDLLLTQKSIDNFQKKNIEAQIYTQIANIYTIKQEYSKAEFLYHKAVVLVDSLSDLKTEIYHNLGSLYFLQDRYEYATLYYLKTWINYSIEPIKNSGRMVDLLTSLGTVYSANGEHKKSLSCFHKVDSILLIPKNYDPLRLIALNINISEVLIKLDSIETALSHYRLASNAISTNLDSSNEFKISSEEGMAECYSRLGQTDSAIANLSNCLSLYTSGRTNNKHVVSRIYLFMGNVFARQKEWEKSIQYYNMALAAILPDSVDFNATNALISKYEPDLLDLYKIYGQLGRSLLSLALLDKVDDTLNLSHSFSNFLIALKICDHLSKDFGQGTSRITFHESTKTIMGGAIEAGFLLQERKNTQKYDALFSIADTNRNRVLLEDLEENRSLTLSGGSDSILKVIKVTKDEIVFYSRKYFQEETISGYSRNTKMLELQDKVIDLKLKLDSLRKKTCQSSSGSHIQGHKEQKAHPSQIMNCLKKDEAMLEYLCSDSILYLFLLRSEGLSMKRIVLSASFYPSLKECLHQLKAGETLNFTSISHVLYNSLITPIETELNGIHRLIIIPDEELSLFPFETLIRENPGVSSEMDACSWHYLLKDFEIIYHFSADAWIKGKEHTKLLKTNYSFAGFAPGFSNKNECPLPVNPIPYAPKEVKNIAGLFVRTSKHRPTFLDSSATEKNFRLYAPKNTHIHIATHSLISDGNPMNSALVFSENNQTGDQQDKNDGLLHLDEISNLHLEASLVVLSACATGEGKVTRTEGVLALTRGFYVAGASNVIYSLWNIPDHITGDFMLDFYRSYFSNSRYSTALREVKLKMISRPETSLPYMWAGIVLLGRE